MRGAVWERGMGLCKEKSGRTKMRIERRDGKEGIYVGIKQNSYQNSGILVMKCV